MATPGSNTTRIRDEMASNPSSRPLQRSHGTRDLPSQHPIKHPTKQMKKPTDNTQWGTKIVSGINPTPMNAPEAVSRLRLVKRGSTLRTPKAKTKSRTPAIITLLLNSAADGAEIPKSLNAFDVQENHAAV
jgi:hypothetical protein